MNIIFQNLSSLQEVVWMKNNTLKAKIMRIVCDILIAIFLLGFILFFLYHMNGSLELYPTEEQEEKIKVMTMLLMIANAVPCIACLAIRIKYRKK